MMRMTGVKWVLACEGACEKGKQCVADTGCGELEFSH
jgi:hypothetical protein